MRFLHWDGGVVSVHEGPALDPAVLRRVRVLVFEYLFLLLFRAVKRLVLLFKLMVSVPGWGHVKAARPHDVPVDICEERVTLYLYCTTSPCAESLARVAIEEMDDEVFGLLRHADWELEDSPLNVVEKLIPKRQISDAVLSSILLTLTQRNRGAAPRSSRRGSRRASTSPHSCRGRLCGSSQEPGRRLSHRKT